ncbi:MAG TPA: hypothetical protein EYH56_00790 [Nanoarchaeota archaeon]|nr:hypothetical protein [Nanoarchaeota archaeon]
MVVEKPIFDLSQIKSEPKSKWLEWFHCWVPGKGSIGTASTLNFTGSIGSATGIFYSFIFWLPKDDWVVKKVDEWIEVSPTHAQYYQLTQAQKSTLEEKIRVGIATAAQIVGEYEMLLHDLRKYKEIVDALKRNDEHRLRAIFVDQVDVHTGEGVSLRSIVSRWPTIIYDFMKLGDEENPDEIAKKLEVSKAEAVILATKNKLYKEWKELFGREVIERYERLQALVNSRKKLVEEYRNWLKPYIARYKMLKLRSEIPSERIAMPFSTFESSGQATFVNCIKLWAWLNLRVFELGFIERAPLKELVYPYDPVVRDIILYGKKLKISPLADIYPFLRKKLPKDEAKELEVVKAKIVPINDARYADKLADEIVKDWLNGRNGWNPNFMYYEFLEIDVARAGLKLPGGEIEDITFDIKMYLISQNILLLKMLELKCREIEFEKYIEEIIGTKKEASEEEQEKEEEKKEGIFPEIKIANPLKRGPYITQFKEQIEKHMFPKVRSDFEDIRSFLLDKFGVK